MTSVPFSYIVQLVTLYDTQGQGSMTYVLRLQVEALPKFRAGPNKFAIRGVDCRPALRYR